MIIKDSATGRAAAVTIEGLKVDALARNAQHVASFNNSDSYQVDAQIAIAASTNIVLHMKNISNNRYIVVDYIRLMSAGAAATNENAYFDIFVGGEYASGGTEIFPINTNVGSPKQSDTTCYQGTGITLTIAGDRIDRNFSANSMQSYSKEGKLIVGPNKSMYISHTGSTVAGVAYARISYYWRDAL